MVLEKYKNELMKCILCGICRKAYFAKIKSFGVCPTLEQGGFESYGPRGKILIAKAVLDGQLGYSEKLVKRLYEGCLLCGNCKVICPLGVDTISIFKAMRQDIVRMGLGPVEPLKMVDTNVNEKFNVFGEDPAKRSLWAEDLDLPKEGETFYFGGCYDSYRFPETAKATIKILNKAGFEVAYLYDDEWCCGAPQIADGSITITEKMLKHNVELLKARGAKRVITSCGGCFHALKTEYKEILGYQPFEVFHISEIILKLIKNGKLSLNPDAKRKVTYHDPCHLGRYEGIYDPPREIIKNITREKFVEMLRNREHAWCCGGGTTVYAAFPEVSAKIAAMRVEEAKNAGAEIIVTACPLCVSVLKPAAYKENIEVYDLPVFIAKEMGL